MVTFIIGLVMLFGGAALYGKLCEKVFGPDDRQTPAYTKNDGVDYVPILCFRTIQPGTLLLFTAIRKLPIPDAMWILKEDQQSGAHP